MKHDLNKTQASMDPKSVRQVLKGIEQISAWIDGGTFYGRKGKGELLVSAPAVDVTLVANTMKWLSKYFWPKTVKGIKRVYRLHDMKTQVPTTGDTVSLKAFKPMLSWTTNETPIVKERSAKPGDCIVSMEKPNVIFTVATLRELAFYGVYPRDEYEKCYAISAELKHTYRKYATENEVVVWHGTLPFKVKVENTHNLTSWH